MTRQSDTRRPVDSAAEFGRVAVLLGGTSSEREVSIRSGQAVLSALLSREVKATAWDPAEQNPAGIADAGFDRVWNALHGPGGEDGSIQGVLRWLGVPCTGSGVLASALAMDKIRSKHVFSAAGITTPPYEVASNATDARRAAEALGLPVIVKPAGQGSSIGMSRVDSLSQLDEAMALALRFDSDVLIEHCVTGDEVTVAVLQGQALPSIRIETPRVFYDYRAKYESADTQYVCPATSDDEREQQYRRLACEAFAALGCTGWGRVDFMHAPGEVPAVIEVNTVPGMTSHSLVPMAANAFGIDFPELCWRVLETSFSANGDSLPMQVAANDA